MHSSLTDCIFRVLEYLCGYNQLPTGKTYLKTHGVPVGFIFILNCIYTDAHRMKNLLTSELRRVKSKVIYVMQLEKYSYAKTK